MFESVLVANRGEIARRIIRTAQRMGLRAVAVYSEADADLPFVHEADEAVLLGPAPPAQSYRDADASCCEAARQSGAEAMHPGYGFLSENADVRRGASRRPGSSGSGRTPEAIEQMGDKIRARNLIAAAGVPVSRGTTRAGRRRRGGGRGGARDRLPGDGQGVGGRRRHRHGASRPTRTSLRAEFERVRGFAERIFGDPAILLERYFPRVRHVEVQVLGLADGRVVALGERDCSVQRRQPEGRRGDTVARRSTTRCARGCSPAAVRAGEAVGYRGAGTVECLLDPAAGEFVFLEMNTRLQVEHPVTEMVTGLDLVEQQLLIAAGRAGHASTRTTSRRSGHAIELRVNAEDPMRFLPGPGH